MGRRLLMVGVCVCGLGWSVPAHAASILIPLDSPTPIIGTIFFDGVNPPVYDVQGATIAAVIDSDTAATIGAGLAVNVAPPPNNNMFLVNLPPTQALNLSFDFASGAFVGSSWDVPVLGTAITSVSDPVLAGFLGNDLAQFTLLQLIPLGGGDLAPAGFIGQYHLDFIAGPDLTPVPEPATLGLLGSGLLFAVRRLRTRARA